MNFSRRQFVKGGVTAFTFGFAAPQVLCDIAFAQGVPSRNLVVVYLGGGNDSLSTVIPYHDPYYAAGGRRSRSRRQRAADRPRFVGHRARPASAADWAEVDLRRRRLAIVQRTGYENQSRSHFTGFDIWGTASPQNTSGHRLARALSRHAAADHRSARGVEHPARDAAAADGAHGRRAGDHQPGDLCVLEPEHRRRGGFERTRRRASRRICRSIGRTWRS